MCLKFAGCTRTLVLQGIDGQNPATGRPKQVTRRGFASAAEAVDARNELLSVAAETKESALCGTTVADLVKEYLDDCEATERLGVKTLFDYRHYLDDYIRPWIGSMLVHDVDAETSPPGSDSSPPPAAPGPARVLPLTRSVSHWSLAASTVSVLTVPVLVSWPWS